MSEATMGIMLRALKLTSFEACHEEVAQRAERDGWSFSKCLQHLVELELNDAKNAKSRHCAKNLGYHSTRCFRRLTGKATFKSKRQLPALCEGGFVDRQKMCLLRIAGERQDTFGLRDWSRID